MTAPLSCARFSSKTPVAPMSPLQWRFLCLHVRVRRVPRSINRSTGRCQMKGLIRLVPLVFTCVLMGACDDDDDTTGVDTRARVQFVNATGDATGLNFSANGQASSQNVTFGTPTSCQLFNAGSTV